MKLEIEIPDEIMQEMTGDKVSPDIIIASLKMPLFHFIGNNYKNNDKIMSWLNSVFMPEFSGLMINTGLTLNNLFNEEKKDHE